MTTIGTAVLQVIPSLRGVSASINKQLDSELGSTGTTMGRKLGDNIAAGALGSGKKIGKDLEAGVADGAKGAEAQVKARLSERLGAQVGSVIGKSIGAGIKVGITGAAAAAAGAVAGIGYTLTKGFERLQTIDQATFKLKALGHSAAETQQIMNDALQAVKGTAFSLADSANIAASAVAAGVKPGKELAQYLSDVADAAAVSGTDLASMGDVMNNVTTLNAAYNDSLQVLAQRGLPIYEWLSKATGKTTADVKELASEGKISAETFQKAIEEKIGGAAQKMGQSFDGAVDNMEASIARLGANFITAVLGGDQAGDALAGPTQAIGNLTEKFDEIGKWVQAHSPEIHAFFEDIKTVALQAGGAIRDIGTWLIQNKGLAEGLAAVFVGWKVVSALSDAAVAARGVATALGLIGPAATAAGAEASGALAGITAPAWLIALLAGGSVVASDAFNKWSNDHPEIQRRDPDTGKTIPGRESQGGHKDPNTYEPIPGGGGDSAQRQRRGLPTYDPTGGLLLPPQPRATGGPVFGAGSSTSDSIPALLSNGEYVVNALAARTNMPLLEAINFGKMPRFADGGAVGQDGRTPYGLPDGTNTGGYGSSGAVFPPWVHAIESRFGVKASTYPGHQEKSGSNKGIDWTGSVDAMQAFAEFLAGDRGELEQVIWSNPKTGQKIGVADGQLVGPGTSQPGYYRNDWAGHTNHVHTRQSFSFGGSAGPVSADVTPLVAANPDAGSSTSAAVLASSSGGLGGSLPSSLSGLAGFGLQGLGAGVGTTGSGSDLGVFGNAASSAVSGQVSSALGVLGINDTPPILQAATQLLGGIKVGGHDRGPNGQLTGVSDGSLFDGSNPLGGLFGGGASAAPLSATSTTTGAFPDGSPASGNGSGTPPGPQTVYNIRTALVEDAFTAAQRKEKQRLAAKVARY